MDSGQVTDSTGNKLNFKNSIIIMTGNVGFQFADNKRIGFNAISNPAPQKDVVIDNLKKFFRPEFLARLNDIIIFDHLSDESLVKIIDFEFNQIKESLNSKGTSVTFSKEVYEFILNKTKSSQAGARKIVFFVENEIKTKIVDILCSNNYNSIKIFVENNELKLNGKTKKLLAVCKK